MFKKKKKTRKVCFFWTKDKEKAQTDLAGSPSACSVMEALAGDLVYLQQLNNQTRGW